VTQPIVNPALVPPGVGRAPAAPPPAPAPRPQGPSFGALLAREQEPVRLSNHAAQRVQRRGIDLSPAVLARLEDGVQRAAAKGARQAVVLVDGTAFVVGVQARTVVTAVDAAHMREHVFTNIDSAVIA